MSSARAKPPTTPRLGTPALDSVRVLGRLLDDLERLRVAAGNRIGALERAANEPLPHLYYIATPLDEAEHRAELELVRAWRKHPLAPFAKSVHGFGEKSAARLIAEIGSPSIGTTGHWEGEGAERSWVIDSQYDRTVSQLWAFCGVGDPARNKIPKGATQVELLKRGNPTAKKQLWLIAVSMRMKGNREVYDARKAATKGRVHEKPCPECHAKAGDPWRDGHRDTDALRIVAKHLLIDLWKADRQLRGLSTTAKRGKRGGRKHP